MVSGKGQSYDESIESLIIRQFYHANLELLMSRRAVPTLYDDGNRRNDRLGYPLRTARALGCYDSGHLRSEGGVISRGG